MQESAFFTATLLVQCWSLKAKSPVKKEKPSGEFLKQHSCAQIKIPRVPLPSPLKKDPQKTHCFLQDSSSISLQILIDQTLQQKDPAPPPSHRVAHNQLKEQIFANKRLKQVPSRGTNGLERHQITAFNAKKSDPSFQDWEAGRDKERKFRIECPHLT